MRRLYRNKHATLIKALADQKNAAKQAEEESKAKEERKKKKLRDKVMADIQNRTELPPIDNPHATQDLSFKNSGMSRARG